ncbi:MAG: DUF4007 family protein [Chloroflexota bacterium]
MGLSESFGFEERWLRRLLKAIPEEPDILTPQRIEEAQLRLGGLGNRQVYAVRDWARASGLTKGSTKGEVHLTRLGMLLLNDDPQIDEDGSLWAIHHALCMNPDDIWFYAHYANMFGPGTFSRAQLKESFSNARNLAESVIEKKCLSPLLHTMKSTRLGDDLGVLIARGDGEYERKAPDPSRLHPAVLAFTVCDWAARGSRSSAHVAEMMQEGGPARYMAIPRETFPGLLEHVQQRYAKRVLAISRTAGLNSVTFEKDMPSLALVRAYYLEHLHGMEPLDALERALSAERSDQHGDTR